jgi:hypothetical protein
MTDPEYEELSPERRPQDPDFDGAGWQFELMEHGGDYPDTMPQAIRATDAAGRSCIYVPVTVEGHVVDMERAGTVSVEEVATPRNIF